jgi:hypothetical protein
VSLRRSSLIAALLAGFSIAGCMQSSTGATGPRPPPPPTRQVVVIVEDSTGARVADAFVAATDIDATAIGEEFSASTDAAGVTSFSLEDGHWYMYTTSGPFGGPTRVAGSTGLVGPRPAGGPDTVLFRLVMRTQSIALGTIMLDGQSAHGGTLVTVVGVQATTETIADGSYELDGLPPGAWRGFAVHPGFHAREFAIVVPVPADTITAGMSFSLAPGGLIARP